jgi:hypothetical protein
MPGSSHAVGVSYAVTQQQLDVALAGGGSGSVASDPVGIDCGTDCSETYDYGTVVTLTPNEGLGSDFVGWSGDPDCSDGSVTVEAAVTCVATFDLEQHILDVTLAGDGTGLVTSDPPGIDCGSDCSETYDYGTVVTLTPTPDLGFAFAGWSGDVDCDDGVVTMEAAATCTATFAGPRTLTVALAGSGMGNVTSSPTGIDCAPDCSESYAFGTIVTLTPSSVEGSTFSGWSGPADCEDGSVTMLADILCTATFLPALIFEDGFESGDTSAWSLTTL